MNTEFDPIESEVWLESHSSDEYLRLYGLHEGNFWDFFNNRWDFGEQLRVTDGMLYTAFIHHFDSLATDRIINSLVLLDYDEEPHSLDNYGTLSKVKSKEDPAPSSHKKKRKTVHKISMFDWKSPCIRKFEYKIYFLNEMQGETKEQHRKSSRFPSDPVNYEYIRPLNILKSAFLQQRKRYSRSYVRTVFASEGTRYRKKDVTPKKNAKYNRRRAKRMMRTTSSQASYNKIRTPSIHSQLAKHDRFLKLNRTQSGASQSGDLESCCNAIVENEIPHFVYSRVEKHKDYDYFGYWEEEPSQSELSNPDSINSERVTLIDIIRERQESRKLSQAKLKESCLHEVRVEAAKREMSLHSYLDNSSPVESRKANHPIFPPLRVRELQRAAIESARSKGHGCASLPTKDECHLAAEMASHNRSEISWKQKRIGKVAAPDMNRFLERSANSSRSGSRLGIDGGSLRQLSDTHTTKSIVRTNSSFRTLEKPVSAVSAGKDIKRVSLQALRGSTGSLRGKKRISIKTVKIKDEPIAINKPPRGIMEPIPVNALLDTEFQKLAKAAFDASNSKEELAGSLTHPVASELLVPILKNKQSDTRIQDTHIKKNASLYSVKSRNASAPQVTPVRHSDSALTKTRPSSDANSSQADSQSKYSKLPNHSLSALQGGSNSSATKTSDRIKIKERSMSNVLSQIKDTFKGRYSGIEFEQSLLEALKSYRVTHESVVSTRGYSISSITISKQPNSNRLS